MTSLLKLPVVAQMTFFLKEIERARSKKKTQSQTDRKKVVKERAAHVFTFHLHVHHMHSISNTPDVANEEFKADLQVTKCLASPPGLTSQPQ